MMGIFDGLPNPGAPALAFQQGMDRARAEREEKQMRGALTAYALNPEDPQAFQMLAEHRPDLAIQVRGERDKREQAAAVADLQRRAAGGDRTAMAELAGIDLDAWDKLADNDRAVTGERASAIGQAALRISQLPEASRPAAWDAAVDQLSARFPELAEYKGQYSPEALMSAIDSAKLVNDFIGLSRPSYQAIPEGGTLVNTRDPAAVQSYMGRLGSTQQPAIPASAVESLRRGDGTAAQFDEVFGAGAAARALGMSGPAPQLNANGDPAMLTPEQYQSVVRAKGQAETDAWMRRNNITIGGR
jgi:hypothetical protein